MINKFFILCFLLVLVAGIQAQEKDFFTFILLPDTENYSAHRPDIAYSQTEWIAASADSLNIQFVFHLGDITDNCRTNEWDVMHSAIHTMDDITPYSLCVGNHDYDFPPVIDDRSTQLFNQYFPHSEAPSTLSGFYQPGIMDNCYHLFQIGYTRYMNLVLEFGPRDEVLEWANQVIAEHPQYKVIISTHCYMNWDDTRVDERDRFNPHDYGQHVNHGEEMWDKLVKKHENIFMVVSGHMLTAGGLGSLVSENNFGTNVYQMLVDYQGYDNGGNGYLRILKFYPDDKRIEATSYSPWLDDYFTDAKNQFVYTNAVEAFASLVPPEFIANPSVTVLEDTPINIELTLLHNYIDDPNHDAAELDFTLQSGQHVQIEQSLHGFSGQTTKDWFGTDTLVCTVTDPTGLADTSDFYIRVLPDNDPPTISDLTHFYLKEDEKLNIDFGFFLNDVDDDLESLEVHLSVLDYSAGLDSAGVEDLNYSYDKQSQMLQLMPAKNVYGTFKTAFTVCDPHELCDTDTISVFVSAVNDKPEISPLPVLQCAEDDSLIIQPKNWRSHITDDSPLDDMQWSFANGTHVSYKTIENQIILKPDANWFGQDSLLAIVTDNGGLADSAFVHINITPINDAPVLAALPDVEFGEDEQATLDMTPFMQDIDNPLEQLTISAFVLDYAPSPSAIQLAAINDLLITVDENALQFTSTGDSSGIFYVVCRVCDPEDACAQDTIQVNIIPKNDPPVFIELPALYWPEDDSLELTQEYFTSFVQDPEHPADALTIQLQSGGIFVDSTETGWTLKTARDWFGDDSLIVLVSDPFLASDTTKQRIHITPVNDAPHWDNIDPLHLQEGVPFELLLGDYVQDVDNTDDELLISFQLSDTSAVDVTFDKALLKMTMQVKTESADTLSLVLQAQDPEGLRAEISTQIFVTPVNDAPVFSALPILKMQEDSQVSLPISAWFPFIVDPDHEEAELDWTIKKTDHIQTQRKDDILTLTPVLNWFGIDSVLVQAQDPVGASDSTWLHIHVAPVNDPPTITDLPDSLVVGSNAENLILWDYIDDVETPDNELVVSLSKTPASLFSYYEKSTGEFILLATSNESFESWLKIYVMDTEKAVAQDSIFVRRWPAGVEQAASVITELALHPCYPNPFNGVTSIRYALPKSEQVQLYVLNILGKHIVTLESGIQQAGEHTLIWETNGLPSGAYFIILQTAQERLVQRCLLVN